MSRKHPVKRGYWLERFESGLAHYCLTAADWSKRIEAGKPVRGKSICGKWIVGRRLSGPFKPSDALIEGTPASPCERCMAASKKVVWGRKPAPVKDLPGFDTVAKNRKRFLGGDKV